MIERVSLPAQGRHWRSVELDLATREAQNAEYREGFMDRYWPGYRSDVYLGSRDAAARFAATNVFSMAGLPGLASMERELRGMVAGIMRVPEEGTVTLTSGGTESNFLACKAAREYGRTVRGIGRPNMVIPITAHPSFDKAGHELGIEVRRVPVGEDHRADPGAIGAALDERTAMVVVSAPCYPQGVVDDVAAVSGICADRGIWLHVDACVGGFLVPFLIETGEPLPEFRFDVEGVWSISADLHKFGHALNGMSSLSVRDVELQRLHTFVLPDPGWTYRPYSRVTFTGSRPGSAIAAAWTTMQLLGQDGYLDTARRIRAAGQAVAEAVATVPGLTMMAPPEAGIAVIRPDVPDHAALMSAALLDRGWDVAVGLTPPTLHILLDPVPEKVLEAFIGDLVSSAAAVATGDAGVARDTAYGD